MGPLGGHEGGSMLGPDCFSEDKMRRPSANQKGGFSSGTKEAVTLILDFLDSRTMKINFCC